MSRDCLVLSCDCPGIDLFRLVIVLPCIVSVTCNCLVICLVLSCDCVLIVLSCLVLSCLVLSCLVLSCLVLSCLVLSCLLSGFALPKSLRVMLWLSGRLITLILTLTLTLTLQP